MLTGSPIEPPFQKKAEETIVEIFERRSSLRRSDIPVRYQIGEFP